jgi:hypothetical protein
LRERNVRRDSIFRVCFTFVQNDDRINAVRFTDYIMILGVILVQSDEKGVLGYVTFASASCVGLHGGCGR